MSQQPINEGMHEVIEDVKQEVTASRRPWYHFSRTARLLLLIYAVQLALFGVLAWWVHFNPVLPLDVAITREFQENPAPWLKITLRVISYPGSSLLLPTLVLLTAAIFWRVGLRLEAPVIVALSAVSAALNAVLKIIVTRPRPHAGLVEIFQAASGQSLPTAAGRSIEPNDRMEHEGLFIRFESGCFVQLMKENREHQSSNFFMSREQQLSAI